MAHKNHTWPLLVEWSSRYTLLVMLNRNEIHTVVGAITQRVIEHLNL
ncbi:MAG: hypothetical protein AAB293_03395 [Pseudomonadota bacterium]